MKAFDRYLCRVQPPLATSPDAKEVMEALTTKNYFTTICDEAFGPMKCGDEHFTGATLEALQSEYFWMDEANNSSPDSPLCSALMSLLGPEGSLFSIMQQTSKPCKGFGPMLRGSWRGDAGGSASPSRSRAVPSSEHTEQPFRSTTLMPVPALCDFSADILNENPDHDLASLPRERVPPLLLLPFWDPPVDLRTVIGRHPKRDSLQSTMLAHFLFRLFSFGNTRCGLHGKALLTTPPPSASATISVWVDYCRKLVLGKEIVNRPAVRSLHFYQKLVLAYIDHFVSAGVVEKFNTKTYASHTQSAGWTEDEIASLICLQGPAAMWLHRSNRPTSELDRCRISDAASLALAAQSLWALEASFVKLESEVGGKGLLCESRDYGALASADLMFPLRTCYRSCLIAIRTMALSLPYVQCSDHVYRDLVRLWRAVITAPVEADAAGMSAYFFHHFEAFSVIFVEMMEMMHSRSFAETASAETFVLVRKALAEFLCDPIPSLLTSVTSLVEAGGRELERIGKWSVLDWSRSDGSPSPIIAPLGEESRCAAARLNLRLSATIALCREKHSCLAHRRGKPTREHEALSAKISAMEEVVESLGKIFPSLAADSEALQLQPSPLRGGRGQATHSGFMRGAPENALTAESLADDATDNVRSPPSRFHALSRLNPPASAPPLAERLSCIFGAHSEGSQKKSPQLLTVTAQGRREYLRGNRASLDFIQAADVRFGGAKGADSYAVMRSHEIPFLVPLAQSMDTLIDFVQYSISTKAAFKCQRGHVLSLVGDSRQRCCEHTMNRAIYECLSCRVGFCEQCSGPVRLGDGRALKSCLPSTVGKSCCDRCGTLFASDACVGFILSSRRGLVWCSGCTSRPWRKISVRFLASRYTYLVMVLVLVLYMALTLLLSLFAGVSAADGEFDDMYHN